MPKIVLSHQVEDIERWLKGKAERVAALSPFATHITDHVAADGSKTVAVTADVHDVPAMQAALANPDPEMSAAMQRHGVIPPVAVHVEK